MQIVANQKKPKEPQETTGELECGRGSDREDFRVYKATNINECLSDVGRRIQHKLRSPPLPQHGALSSFHHYNQDEAASLWLSAKELGFRGSLPIYNAF